MPICFEFEKMSIKFFLKQVIENQSYDKDLSDESATKSLERL